MESLNFASNKHTSSLGHRRQASVGLGIITDLDTTDTTSKATASNNTTSASVNSSKNASFFETPIFTTPTLPPRLTPLNITNGASSPATQSSSQLATTYTDRLRNIAASMNNNNSNKDNDSLSPIPVNHHTKNTNMQDTANSTLVKVRRARSYRFKPPYYNEEGYDDDDDDGIMPLPSPVPTSAIASSSSSSTLLNRLPHDLHDQLNGVSSSRPGSSGDTLNRPVFATSSITSPHSPVTPPSPSTSTSIPIIAISPTIVHKNDVIPQLSAHPMLGDMDDPMFMDHTPSQQPNQQGPLLYHHKSSGVPTNGGRRRPGAMVREASSSSGLPTISVNPASEENLIDKQLGDYYIRRLLGTGAFSKVYLAERRNNEQVELFAIKTINKSSMINNLRFRSSIEREVGILKFIDHPHIAHIEATMETEHNLCLILEYAQGMELFDFVQQMHQRLHSKNEKVNEGLIKKIFLQLVLVVKWMHEHNIVHRDLKLENILIHMDEQHQGEPILKVTDFGLARVIDPDSPILTTRCGSEEYAAPEIVQSKGYDGRQTDTWALGVILYALLVGYLPFRYDATKGERVTQMFYRIVRAQVKWPKTWDQHHHIAITPQAKEVVERILVRQPEQRIHLDDIDGLPWFQQQ